MRLATGSAHARLLLLTAGTCIVIASACSRQDPCAGLGSLCTDGKAMPSVGEPSGGGVPTSVDGGTSGVGGEVGMDDAGPTAAGAGGMLVEDSNVRFGESSLGGQFPVEAVPAAGASGEGGAAAAGDGGASGSGGNMPTGGKAGGPPQSSCDPVEQLPFVVTKRFSPFNQDYCTIKRAPYAVGVCSAPTWQTQDTSPRSWQGFACIEPGANTVRFQARGDYGGETVRFVVPPASTTGPITLTDTWAYYEVNITGLDYNANPDGTVGRTQALTVEPVGDVTSMRVYVDDVRYIRGTPDATQCTPVESRPDNCPVLPPPGDEITFCHTDGAPPTQTADSLLLDDLEDGDDLSLSLPDGRGVWNVFNDGSPLAFQYPACGFPTQIPGEHDASNWSFLTYGCGFQNWGNGIQLILRADTPGCHDAFDASAYAGVDFKMRGNGTVRFAINTVDTTPPQYDGICDESSGICFHAYEASVVLQANWTSYRVPFATMNQSPASVAFATSSILTIGWVVNAQPGFFYAVDDVALYVEGAPGPGGMPGMGGTTGAGGTNGVAGTPGAGGKSK